ncbi:hypothetical protein O181_008697 [Austropuccinia psidii MF-1]|uniref:Tet-like 2OG-Fe(II) oxygenase domain-containing protein n=1 Tax=Austropuccinia psidii MF-1 TaxID=1389203 RepID=A0A9Q3BPA5_9BASI|nr:hypothetical protein [Austropuccinia psidii MF-1]
MNPHGSPYILINATVPSELLVIIYQVHCFNHLTLICQNLKYLIMSLNNLAHIRKNITTNKNILAGIMRGIGFRQHSDKGKSAGLYARKPGLTIKEFEDDNHKWNKLKKYKQFIPSRTQTLSKIVHEDNMQLMNEANLPNFSQTEWTTSNEFKSFSNFIITKNGFHNKVHVDENDINAWSYGIFSFIQKHNFDPVPTSIPLNGH